MEHWFRRLAAWVADDLHICQRVDAATGHGLRLCGQSMGGYAALELARAMPEQVSAVGVGAPCFDACRLDWLADRLLNVPLWMMIGRQDSMCSYPECSSLVLKMRDRGALLARISSAGIKDHNSACLQLEKNWLYQWFWKPLRRHGPDTDVQAPMPQAGVEEEDADKGGGEVAEIADAIPMIGESHPT
jgi:pimeloyl-ACP methyl ester carboxylesterase